jgi:hypothetical protein
MTSTIKDLDGGYELAPYCRKFINADTLGTEDDRVQFIEVLTDVYRKHPGPNHTTTPRTYARRYVEELDAVTINILHTGWLRNAIDVDVLNRIKIWFGAEDARNFAMLRMESSDIPAASAGVTRQFLGLKWHFADADGAPPAHLDISTDDMFHRNLAVYRYALAVTNEWHGSLRTFYRGGADGDDLVLAPEIWRLVYDHPEKADLLARLVVEREDQDIELLSNMVAHDIAPSLSSGVL